MYGKGASGGDFIDDDDDDDEDDDDDDRGRVDRLRFKLPSNFEVREVSGSHRKPCSQCGMNDFFPGSFYVYDCVNPWGTDKFCLDCAEMRFGGHDDEDEEEDDEDEEDITTPAPVMHADGGTYDATGWQSWPPVESGDWGLVYVTRGHLGGRFVYYDDEEDEDEAIVYVGRPLTSACYTVRLSSLRQPPFAGTLRSGMGAHDSEPPPVPAIAPPAAARSEAAPAPPAAAPALAARRNRSGEQPAAPVPGISGRLRSSPKRGSSTAGSSASSPTKSGRRA